MHGSSIMIHSVDFVKSVMLVATISLSGIGLITLLVCLAGDLLKLLDFSSEDHVLLTTYGKLQPPLGKHRLKVYLLLLKELAFHVCHLLCIL